MAWRWVSKEGTLAPFVGALLVTVLAAAVLFSVDRIERRGRILEARAEVLTRLDAVRAKLEGAIVGPLLRTRGVAAQIVLHGDITPSEFDRLAPVLLEGHRNVVAIAVSRGTVIAMVYPREGNEKTIGVDYRSLPGQWPTVRRAIETRRPLLQGPVTLIQGYPGLVVRAPVFLRDPAGGGEGFFGIVSVVLNVDGVLADAGLKTADLPLKVAIRGRDGLGAAGEIFFGDAAVFAGDPVEMDVILPYGSWRMAAIPRGGWEGGPGQTGVLGLCVLMLVAAISFGTAYHVVRLKRSGAALAVRSAELERSNAELERFAYVSSHDLQTPLRNVVSYSQLLERRYRDRLDADAGEFIGFIVEGGRRMSGMIGDLLDYARVGNPGDTPLTAVAAGSAFDTAVDNLAAGIAAAGATVTRGDLPVVLGEMSRLTILFQNLIANGIKYRHPGRPAEITVTAGRTAPGEWRFAVADNGIGIEAEYFRKVFEIFQRLQPAEEGEGTGIGLALCRRIVHRFGGTIWVELAPGVGTTFFFTLGDGLTGITESAADRRDAEGRR